MHFPAVLMNLLFSLCFTCYFVHGLTTSICNRPKQNTKWTCKKVSECPYSRLLFSKKLNVSCDEDLISPKICCPESTNMKLAEKKIGVPVPINKISNEQHRNASEIARKSLIGDGEIRPSSACHTLLSNYFLECQEYAKYRFINETIESQIIGEPPIFNQIRDCKEIEPLIVGGVEAESKEFPHMALIGYGENISEISWICGGSLISEQFILSAAHCTNNYPAEVVNWVALGVLSKGDITADKLNENLFRIVERFDHPDYHFPWTNNDISLYKLEIPITLSPSIRPICLYTSKELPTDNDMKASVTGWGRTDAAEDSSETLLKVTINFLSNELCNETYKFDVKFKHGFEPESMVCAGDQYNSKDTCQGDSGGPLQVPLGTEFECMWNQVGITSLGSAFCGSNTPSIYTKVTRYLPWIQSIVWPV